MVSARGWYVKAMRYAWPNSTLLASGLFDDHGAAFAEMRRIRPFYPEATLDVVMQTGKNLPVRKPRSSVPLRRPCGKDCNNPKCCDVRCFGIQERPPVPEFDLSVPAQRWDAADAIAAKALSLGAEVGVERWEDDQDVTMRVPFLSCNIWTAWTPAAPMPIISWRAAQGLVLRQHLPGAWSQLTEYAGRHGKATSVPDTWAALFDALEIGLLAGIDGSAFDL